MTQIEKLTIFRNTLKRYNPNDFLNEEDFNVVLNLFKNHPSWKIKEGCGVLKIQVILNQWKTKSFLIHRKDNSYTDISFVIAVKGIGDFMDRRLRGACRTSIRPIIHEIRDKVIFNVDRCPFTSEILTKENTHIDHYDMTFNQLYKLWMQKQDPIKLLMSLNDNKKDNVVHDYFTDDEIIKDFIDFHNQHTHLRAVSKKANLSILKKIK